MYASSSRLVVFTHLFLLFTSAFFFVNPLHVADDDDNNDIESKVVVLDEDNFDETISKKEFVFVEFYAPWCGHCKNLQPEYEVVANSFSTEKSSIVISKVDCTENQALSEKFGIRGFPTLKLFRKGTPLEYEGGRTAADIIQWLKKKTGPPSLHLTTEEAYKTFVGQPVPHVVAFVTESSVPVWNALAGSGKLDDFVLAHVTDLSVAVPSASEEGAEAQQRKLDTVVIFKVGEAEEVYEGSFEHDPLLEFILTEGYPLIDELAQKIWIRSSSTSKPLLAIFLPETGDDSMIMVRAIATQLKGKVLTSFSSAKSLAERWGSSGKVLPTAILVVWKDGEPKMTVYDEESAPLTVETSIEFVEEVLKGTYKGYKKSEPVPETNNGPVTVIVGKTFDSIVFDKEKDVFVEFYAPWCGHCKNLAPIWDELGKHFSTVSTVVIGKIDATSNFIPDNIDIKGFPTLFYFPADNKEGIPYVQDRDLESLKAFVVQHASRTVSEKTDL